MQLKVLFLLKQNQSYGSSNVKSGLFTSAKMVSDSLHSAFDVDTEVRVCVDGNSIDREVQSFKPDVCFIEAIWVTPAKMKELRDLHPYVLFIVRVHSKITFLANEGIAIKWLKEYVKIGVAVSFNNRKTNTEVNNIGIPSIYLPNLYKVKSQLSNNVFKHIFSLIKKKNRKDAIDIGCFGAIRPLKNQLQQALGAIRFGEKYGKQVRFHINAGRCEQQGENILKNIRALFEGTKHILVEHGWLSHEDFKALISQMDVGLQVSLTESFNIVAADFVELKKPLIASKGITWIDNLSKVDCENSEQLADKINDCIKRSSFYAEINLYALMQYNLSAYKAWENFVKALHDLSV